ncbi:acyl transferase/acyl hydrolase/lysophospholipase [Thelonectria olida]|uniref:Acyl transferase/acyl hydrolase/lysophospholipase n=1 Tax=Thelonectria olida TaxID=1576542 RepID=A0A9P9ALY0_9HYPO|nr:acyl transferase/acyl hydrolase/lysophospholipase [Thelonectria olida]
MHLKLPTRPSLILWGESNARCNSQGNSKPIKATYGKLPERTHSGPEITRPGPIDKLLLVTSRSQEGQSLFKQISRRACAGQVEQDPPNEPWEAQGRVRLMDSGLSNNLPNHILARPERCADVIVAFDASSDVQTDSAIRRIHNFAEDCHINLEDTTNLFERPPRVDPVSEGAKSDESRVRSQYINRYASVFRGTRQNGHSIYIVYCPLLPNVANPSFNPSQVSFSTSYNLVWTQDQVHELFQTVESNTSDYAMHIVRQVLTKVYLDKKAKRNKQADSSP